MVKVPHPQSGVNVRTVLTRVLGLRCTQQAAKFKQFIKEKLTVRMNKFTEMKLRNLSNQTSASSEEVIHNPKSEQELEREWVKHRAEGNTRLKYTGMIMMTQTLVQRIRVGQVIKNGGKRTKGNVKPRQDKGWDAFKIKQEANWTHKNITKADWCSIKKEKCCI